MGGDHRVHCAVDQEALAAERNGHPWEEAVTYRVEEDEGALGGILKRNESWKAKVITTETKDTK